MPQQVIAALEATAVESLDESAYSYQSAVGGVPSVLHDRLELPADEEVTSIVTEPAWCLCEMPEGDYSRVRVFPTLESLAAHIGRLEGDEVSVWAFYGTPLRLTSMGNSGQRYLLVSDQEVVVIPQGGDTSLQLADDPILPPVQEDGWLGDEAFTQGSTENYYAYESPQDDQFDPIDDDDDA